MKDLISVIIPIYNVEKYLSRCINSVIAQTYKNLEIILVNDGSFDSSGIICDEFALKDSRIKVIHKKNGGLSDARNVGINIANGFYFTFIDSDDWVSNDFLEKLYNLCINYNAEISICDFVETKTTNTFLSDLKNNQVIQYTNIESLYQLTKYSKTQFGIVCGKLYHKKLFDNVRFPVGKIHEDEFVSYILIYNANKIVYIDRKMYYYFMRNESITRNNFNIRNKLNALEAFQERASFYKNINEFELYEIHLRKMMYLYTLIYKNIELLHDSLLKEKFIDDYVKFKLIFEDSNQSNLNKLDYKTKYIFHDLYLKLKKYFKGRFL